MVFLALAVACSTAIAVIFKLTEGRYDRIALVTVNYAAAVVVALVLLAIDPPARGLTADGPLIVLGCVLGFLFIAGFGLFSKAIGVAGISLATATMRLSVAVPFLASWFVWHEVPTSGQTCGLLRAGGAFLLISRPSAPASAANLVPEPTGSRRPSAPLAAAILLALLFIAGGLVDTSLKVFEEEFAAENSRSLFLLVVFGVALLFGGMLVGARRLRSGVWPKPGVVPWGVVLGLVNYGSAEFMLLALRDVPGTVAFPVNNVAVVALATFLGIAFWSERPSRANRVGLVLAIIALALLAF